MTHELIGGYAAADDHEEMGRFLRHAFPLGLESFAGLVSKSGENDCEREQLRRDTSVEKALLARIH
jgi:hypothetical protein